MNAQLLRRGMGWWPPFLGAGIRVRSFADDFREAVVELKMGRFNRNYVGTHFGGSLYAMTDPFFMIMLLHNLGGDYLVWDKSGSIEYVAPGRRKPKHRPAQ
jgi:acyl-coenzyme A thioesterase PaaI-like protein